MADMQQSDRQLNGGGSVQLTPSESLGSKRQRRPSVRLGEIGGDQLYEAYSRRVQNAKPRKNHSSVDYKREASAPGKAPKVRPLTDKDCYSPVLRVTGWGKKQPCGATAKQGKTSWASKIDETDSGGIGNADGEEKYSGDEDGDDGYREFNAGNSESPAMEQSPIQSSENLGDGNDRNERDLFSNRVQLGVELSGPSDTDGRDYMKKRMDACEGEDGVRFWLNSLGLGRYAPVFEIHEVDDEVLPLLTLEDLKDMGINAVGSRRKLFCAIQKLGKGFS